MKIDEAIIVEGIYDKNRLKQFITATIIAVNGFNIFSDKNTMLLIRRLAENRGIVVMTDSDKAGFMIRNYIKECIPSKYIKHAYIPEVIGKERRKSYPSKEGLLGVEGIDNNMIVNALLKSGCTINEANERIQTSNITKVDLYHDGFTGKPHSAEMRNKLLRKLNLPSKVSTNALLDILNALYSYDEYKELVKNIT